MDFLISKIKGLHISAGSGGANNNNNNNPSANNTNVGCENVQKIIESHENVLIEDNPFKTNIECDYEKETQSQIPEIISPEITLVGVSFTI